MTMQLVIGVGSSFLQELVQQTGNGGACRVEKFLASFFTSTSAF
jgi:hypothetical protein